MDPHTEAGQSLRKHEKVSIQRKLQRCRDILVKIAERPDCGDITGYDKIAIDVFVGGIEAAIRRYKSESIRARKYYP